MTWSIILTVVVQGVLTGLVYGLMALGLSVIFGVVRVVNFAHGEMMTIAMYVAIVLFSALGLETHWYSSALGAHLSWTLPFGVLVMRGFFRTIPTAIIEAARLDGCSWFRIFYRIALPLALPAVISLCILDGVATWNEFILAQIFLRSDELRTLPLGLVQFSTQFSTQYDQLAAAVLISVAPIVLVFLFFQRYFITGMRGAVK